MIVHDLIVLLALLFVGLRALCFSQLLYDILPQCAIDSCIVLSELAAWCVFLLAIIYMR